MKGQSAVEYVMTYGWAILALIIVLGVILWSGALSPTYLISEECTLGSNLPCSFILYNEGGETRLSMIIYNGFSYKINIEDIEVYDTSEDVYFSDEPSVGTIESGDSTSFTVDYPGELPADSFKKFVVRVTYASCAPELLEPGEECSSSQHTISGRITGRVNVQ